MFPIDLSYLGITNSHVINTLVLVVVLFVLRGILIRRVAVSKFGSFEDRRRVIVQIKNISGLILVFGMFLIWAAELRNFALSMVAVAAAIAVASRELILCLLGGFYKVSTRPFDVGDRIAIDEFRGDVIDHDFLHTKLVEIGPGHNMHQFTGRIVSVPNSLFLTKVMLNESRERYQLHAFHVVAPLDKHWRLREEALLSSAREESVDYLKEAQKFLERMSEKEGFEVPNAEPRVSFHFDKPDEVTFVVRVPTPGLRKGRIEQNILHKYLEKITPLLEETPAKMRSKHE